MVKRDSGNLLAITYAGNQGSRSQTTAEIQILAQLFADHHRRYDVYRAERRRADALLSHGHAAERNEKHRDHYQPGVVRLEPERQRQTPNADAHRAPEYKQSADQADITKTKHGTAVDISQYTFNIKFENTGRKPLDIHEKRAF